MTYLQPYSFPELGLTAPDVQVLSELQSFNATTERHLSTAMEFPEPSLTLDLGRRLGDELREFNYLHQMSLLHATHFEMANKIKTAYIVDCYLWSAARLNPLGLFSAARSLLELHAMLYFVTRSLIDAAQGAETEWRERGIRFFRAIVKARFGTTDPELQRILKGEGLDEEAVQPIRLHKARKLLAIELSWLDEHYATLCDYVHHNLRSQRVTGAFSGESAVARSSSGGQLILSEAAPMTQYTFPLQEPGRQAITKTAARVLISVKGIVNALNAMPRTPFTDLELMRRTGSRVGLRTPGKPRPRVARRKPGRNEPCPCGSEKKFKSCHGAAQ